MRHGSQISYKFNFDLISLSLAASKDLVIFRLSDLGQGERGKEEFLPSAFLQER